MTEEKKKRRESMYGTIFLRIEGSTLDLARKKASEGGLTLAQWVRNVLRSVLGVQNG